MYATVHHWDEFQRTESVRNETYYSYVAATTPAFVDSIAERLQDDPVYFLEEDGLSSRALTYVCAREKHIDVIGWRVESGENFEADLSTADSVYDLPEWLQDHPVQRLLKLMTDADDATAFALTPRVFPKDLRFRRITWGVDDNETIFRPAFPSSETPLTAPIRQNTIASYLLQNFGDGSESSIFQALKRDGVEKGTAAKKLIESEAAKYQSAFDGRFGIQRCLPE
jgi:hypothetical protein